MTKAQKFLLNFFIIDNTAEKGIRKRENVNRESHYYTFSLFHYLPLPSEFIRTRLRRFSLTPPPTLSPSPSFLSYRQMPIYQFRLFYSPFYYVERIC